jgi:hypothetical protein
MKTTTKTIIGILLIALMVAGVWYFAGQFGLSTISSGATILSISDARFVSNAPDVGNSDAYLISAVVNKGGEKLIGEITPKDLANYGLTQTPSGPITVEFDLNSVSCNYQIIDDAKPFYKIYQASSRTSLCGRNCNDGCAEAQAVPWDSVSLDTVKKACKGTWGVASRTPFVTDGTLHNPEMCSKTYAPPGTDLATPSTVADTTDCDSLIDIQSTPIRPDIGQQSSEWAYLMPSQLTTGFDGDHWVVTHVAGALQYTGNKIDTVAAPKFSVNVKITNSKGESFNTTVTDTQTVASLGEIGRIKFAGNLLAQQFCPVPAVNQAVLENSKTHALTVVDKTLYDQYQANLFDLINFDNNYYAKVNSDPGIGADVLWSKMSTLNAALRNIAAQNKSDACQINGRIYSCTPSGDVVYPQVQLIVKASWVGVQVDSGVPQISKVTPQAISYAGDVNAMDVIIANVGTRDDSFDMNLFCGGSAVNLGTIRAAIPAGNTEQIKLNYLLQQGNYSCQVTAASVNNPLAKDSKNVSLTIVSKPTPTVNQCTSIPKQPSNYCTWDGYPNCNWTCTQPPQDKTWLYVTIAIIAIVVIGGIVWLKK